MLSWNVPPLLSDIGLQTLGGVPNVPLLPPNMPERSHPSAHVHRTRSPLVRSRIHVDWNRCSGHPSPVPGASGHVAAQPGATVSGLDANGRFYLGVDVGTYQVLPTVNLQHMARFHRPAMASVNTALAVDSLNDFLVTLLPNVTDSRWRPMSPCPGPGSTSISSLHETWVRCRRQLQFAFDPSRTINGPCQRRDLVGSAVWDFTGAARACRHVGLCC